MRLIKRITLVIRDGGKFVKVFYPGISDRRECRRSGAVVEDRLTVWCWPPTLRLAGGVEADRPGQHRASTAFGKSPAGERLESSAVE